MKKNKMEEQNDNLRESVCCPSTFIQKAMQQQDVWIRETPGYLGPTGRLTAISTQPKGSGAAPSCSGEC